MLNQGYYVIRDNWCMNAKFTKKQWYVEKHLLIVGLLIYDHKSD